MRTRIVFDSNVYISAARPGTYSRGWLDVSGSLNRNFDVYASESILAEVREVLVTKIGFRPLTVDQYVESLRKFLVVVDPSEKTDAVKRDLDDNKVLECAVEAKANIIISADRDLLQLRGYKNITVYHPNNLKYLFPLDFGKTT